MFKGYIYCIENKISGKKYIGKTEREDINERWGEHYYDLVKNKHGNKHLQNSWNKYKEGNFDWYIIEDIISETFEDRKLLANKQEKYYIELFDSSKPQFGYNKTLGGDGMIPNEEIRKKISESHKGKKLTLEHRKNISKSVPKGKDHRNYNNLQFIEMAKRVGKANKGKKHTEESLQKMSIATSGESNGMYNKHHTIESRYKMSISRKGKTQCLEQRINTSNAMNNYNRKKLEDKEQKIIEIYFKIYNGERISDLLKTYDVSRNIMNAIKHKRGIYAQIIDSYMHNNNITLKPKKGKYFERSLKQLKISKEQIISIYNSTLNNEDHKYLSQKFNVSLKIIKSIADKSGIYYFIIEEYENMEGRETNDKKI